MSWDPLIQDSARESFEKSIQKQGFPNFQIYELDANRQPLRAKDRTSYVVPERKPNIRLYFNML